jgi:SAM-dependent methyltransferase
VSAPPRAREGTARDAAPALRERVRRYYTAYYRDALGIADWPVLVDLRESEERQEAARLERLERLVGAEALAGRVLNVGCGTGGFNVALARARPGARVTGIDADGEATAICALKRDGAAGAFARAAAEALPFRDGAFDLVYCFSSIEHVASVAAAVREMVRVTRPGGRIYVHTPNAWSWYEGHYKLLWVPFLPHALGRAYLRARGRPPGYLASIRRLTPGQLARAFAASGVRELAFHDEARPRESRGPAWRLFRLYYAVTGTSPFIELVARKAG